MATIREEHWVVLQGKRFPTYPGVLLAAHEAGLLGIEVTVLQYPAADNGNTAVCQAIVTMKGEDGRELLFQEIADANPSNVNRMIVPHLLRMAATRAKGRALRDALALGQALFEELGPDAEHQNGHQTQQEARTAPAQRAKHDPADQATKTVCAVCGENVPAAVANAALKEFSEPLCIPHARERRARRAETETATV